jgi:CheY-like chemotaxis protein
MARVLMLEDEPTLVNHLPRLLKEAGLNVIATTSIAEALGMLLSADDFDAIMLDIMMPPPEDIDPEKVDYGRLTGIEVARQMKDICPDVPIVVFTVLTDPEIRVKIREAGAAMIIDKPTELDEIAAALWRVIQPTTQ